MINKKWLFTVCQQIPRGVLAVFGQLTKKSFHIIKSFTNSYSLPFITWSKPIEPDESRVLRLKEDRMTNENVQESHFSENNHEKNKNFQLFLQPNLGSTLISLIKQSGWDKVYYVYNYDEGSTLIWKWQVRIWIYRL